MCFVASSLLTPVCRHCLHFFSPFTSHHHLPRVSTSTKQSKWWLDNVFKITKPVSVCQYFCSDANTKWGNTGHAWINWGYWMGHDPKSTIEIVTLNLKIINLQSCIKHQTVYPVYSMWFIATAALPHGLMDQLLFLRGLRLIGLTVTSLCGQAMMF